MPTNPTKNEMKTLNAISFLTLHNPSEWRRMDGWMDGWMNEWVNGCTIKYYNYLLSVPKGNEQQSGSEPSTGGRLDCRLPSCLTDGLIDKLSVEGGSKCAKAVAVCEVR